MNAVRYYLALIWVVSLAPGPLLFWLLIHPFVRFWRRVGPGWAYGVVGSLWALAMAGLFLVRHVLLAVEFGTNYYLTALGLVLLAASTWLGLVWFRRMRLWTIMGLPELAPDRAPPTAYHHRSLCHYPPSPLCRVMPGPLGQRPHCQLPGPLPGSGPLAARHLCRGAAGRKGTAGPLWCGLWRIQPTGAPVSASHLPRFRPLGSRSGVDRLPREG